MQSTKSDCSKLPTVDLGELGVNHTEEPSQHVWEHVTRQLAHALSSVGCAYLTGHGVPNDLIEETFSSGIEFFSKERDFKNCWATKEKLSGYLGIASEKYSDDVNREKHEGFIFNQDNFGPAKKAPPFLTTVTPLIKFMHALSRRLMITLALSLNKDKDYFLNMHLDSGTSKSLSVCRLNYYPVSTSDTENCVRFGAHRDFSTISLLISNNREGFQICDSSGQWVDVPYIPGTILLLAGEFLHFYSNKRFIPPLHRVVAPKEKQPAHQRPRCSFVYFEHADQHTPLWPPSDNPDRPAPPTIREHADKIILGARAEAVNYSST